MHDFDEMESLKALCYKLNEYEVTGPAVTVDIHHGHRNDANGRSTANRNSTGSAAGGSRRKMSRWDQPEANHSNGSLLTTMNRFVETVDDMNETILVPHRLMDVKFEEKKPIMPVSNGGVMTNLNGVDLFQFYTILNSVKNDLMWGNKNRSPPQPQSQGVSLSSMPSSASICNSVVTVNSNSSSKSTTHSNEIKGHVRRPSTVSTTSSVTSSDAEFPEMDDDSGVEAEEEYSQQMADAFHHHLSGLQQCLRDLTLVADNITTRYNNDVGGI